MDQASFERKTVIDYLIDRRRRRNRIVKGLIGLMVIAGGLGYFGHWYFNLGGKLLVFPGSATVCRISELKDPGNYRFRANIKRAFSLLAIALERESYLAMDGTGNIRVDFPHTVEFPDREVWVVGMVRGQGSTFRAVWIDDRFSWHLALEVIVPVVIVFLGICLMYVPFGFDPGGHRERVSGGKRQEPRQVRRKNA